MMSSVMDILRAVPGTLANSLARHPAQPITEDERQEGRPDEDERTDIIWGPGRDGYEIFAPKTR